MKIVYLNGFRIEMYNDVYSQLETEQFYDIDFSMGELFTHCTIISWSMHFKAPVRGNKFVSYGYVNDLAPVKKKLVPGLSFFTLCLN